MLGFAVFGFRVVGLGDPPEVKVGLREVDFAVVGVFVVGESVVGDSLVGEFVVGESVVG